MKINKNIRLDRYPEGLPTSDIFSISNNKVPDISAGQYLIKNLFIAIDPALVGRLRNENNYAEQVQIGEVMHAYCVGEVIESKNSAFSKGQKVYGQFGMQEYKISDENTVCFPVKDIPKLSYYLGVLGTTGATAYFALNEICQPKKDECLVVSSAASSVGSIAGQLGKIHGCRTIGIVSTEEKAKWAKKEYGYDEVISYRNKSICEIEHDISLACPTGVDMYFDNTSGNISEALLNLYNDHARIAVVGRMGLSHLNDTTQDIGRRDNSIILSKRIKKQGFVVLDYIQRFTESAHELYSLISKGELIIKEDILEGVENLPTAFMNVVQGKNQGKQIVKLC